MADKRENETTEPAERRSLKRRRGEGAGMLAATDEAVGDSAGR